MMTVRSVQSGNGDARLIGALAIKDTVAARTDGSQRFRRQCFQSRLRTLCFYDERSLTIVPWTTLITSRTQATRTNYVVRDTGLPSR